MIVSQIGLLRIWGDLLEALHGIHGFGGHTVEIYAYRLHAPSVDVHLLPETVQATQLAERATRAAADLCEIVSAFEDEYSAHVFVHTRDGTKPLSAETFTSFGWRVHLDVYPQGKVP